MEYYSAFKKEEILHCAATWVNLEIIVLSEISQSREDKYYMIPLKAGTYNSQNHRENGMVVVRGWEERMGSMFTGFQFYRMKRIMDSGDGCTTL